MSYPTPHPHCATVVGIDPGTGMLGLGAIQFGCDDFRIRSVYTQSFSGEKLPSLDYIGEIHGAKVQRLDGHRENLLTLFNEMQPNGFACESPFFSFSSPSAFGPLVEAIAMIRTAVWLHSPWHELTMIDPPSVKNAVGAKGGDKKLPVQEALLQVAELNPPDGQNLSLCDEHAVDALAVAYAKFVMYRNAFLGLA